jgi:hypothetical protein
MSKFENFKSQAQGVVTVNRALLVGGALVMLWIFGRETVSYFTTATRMVTERVRSNVPLEFELERAKTMISEMLPDIRRNMVLIAQEEVGAEQTRREVADAEDALDNQRDDLLRLRADLSNQAGVFLVGNRPASPDEVREELTRRFHRFQTAETTVEAKRQLLRAREQSLLAAREKLGKMLNTKQNLEVEVENLSARLQRMENKSVAQDIKFDDDQVERCEKLVSDLRIRLETADRLLAASGDLETIVTASYVPSHDDIAMQIDRYFAAK